MRLFVVLALAVSVFLAAQVAPSFAETRTAKVTQVLIDKSARKLYLLNGRRALRTYDISLGFQPKGHKQFQGDGRTPEGLYYITHRNPQSAFYLSLGVSYPNGEDRAYAQARGREPGGDIFIHGRGPNSKGASGDWTAGCIAVTDAEMAEIYRYVEPGTPIYIKP